MKRLSLKYLLITLVLGAFVLTIVVIANVYYGINITSMTRDVTVLGAIHPFSGFVSSLGILLWCGTASISLLTAIICFSKKLKNVFEFFLSSAFLSTYLLLDDLFLFHEQSGSIGLSEKIVFSFLGIAVALYLFVFKKIILKSNYLMLIISLSFLLISIIIDSIQPYLWQKGNLHALLEDGTKWLGIVRWSSYHFRTSRKFLASNVEKV